VHFTVPPTHMHTHTPIGQFVNLFWIILLFYKFNRIRWWVSFFTTPNRFSLPQIVFHYLNAVHLNIAEARSFTSWSNRWIHRILSYDLAAV